MSDMKTRHRSLGPAPFASFDDILPDDGNEETSSQHVSVTFAPRIDISRASSSPPREDTLDNSNGLEIDIVDDIDLLGSNLGVGFKEDSTLDLRSSTEDLMFEDPLVANKIRSSRSTSPTHMKIESELFVINQHRKNSQCSDGGFLSISGRTSRLSSYGSHLSINSNRSDVSRSSSPARLLIETSFCTSHSPVHSPHKASLAPKVITDNNLTVKNQTEAVVVTKKESVPPKPKEGETEFIYIPLKGPLKPKGSTKKSIAETVFGNKKRIQRLQTVNVKTEENSKDCIRIKLKPDHLYKPVEKPTSLNLGVQLLTDVEVIRQEIEPHDRQSKTPTTNLQIGDPGMRSRKNSFSDMIKHTLAPTRASLAHIFKSSSRKSISETHSKKPHDEEQQVIRIPLRTPSLERNNIVEEISKQVQEMCHNLDNWDNAIEGSAVEPVKNGEEDDNDNDNDNDKKMISNSTTSQSLNVTNILGEAQSSSELKTLMFQDESSFDDDLVFVPTTLPMERSVAMPIVPIKERMHCIEKWSSIDRPRSSSIVKSNLDDYDFVQNFNNPPPNTNWVNFENIPDDIKVATKIEMVPSTNYSFKRGDSEDCSCECHEVDGDGVGFGSDVIIRDEDQMPLLTDDESV